MLWPYKSERMPSGCDSGDCSPRVLLLLWLPFMVGNPYGDENIPGSIQLFIEGLGSVMAEGYPKVGYLPYA